ncbi:MAG: NAD(P)-dependent dehydrogenase (short-subunit alcohol dehydrogenase family) [Paracoccaceae bacterium]|jgi:NAD(P)-dependent dehydrogenase (short-subunit alcohol dehydrogenase family)
MGQVAGKRVAVIGAGSVGAGWGNGKAAAVTYAREGARVFCVDRNAEAAAETVAIIQGEGHQASGFVGDMTSEDDVTGFLAAMQAKWGGIDILHFNIGISAKGGVADQTLVDWNRIFAVNLTAAMLVSRAVLPGMKHQRSGALVFISSLAAQMAGPYSYASYEASKAGLCRMSASIAKEYAPFNVRSNTILPGMIDTPHVTCFIGPDTDPETLANQRAAMVPMGRQGTAWDIANAALFLASDQAGFITGVDLRVDGGMGG